MNGSVQAFEDGVDEARHALRLAPIAVETRPSVSGLAHADLRRRIITVGVAQMGSVEEVAQRWLAFHEVGHFAGDDRWQRQKQAWTLGAAAIMFCIPGLVLSFPLSPQLADVGSALVLVALGLATGALLSVLRTRRRLEHQADAVATTLAAQPVPESLAALGGDRPRVPRWFLTHPTWAERQERTRSGPH